MSRVRVVAKIRPFLADEQTDDTVRVEASGLSLTDPRNPAQRILYKDFAACYDESSPGPDDQNDLFDQELGPCIGECFNGKTLAVICYGVTSSGKTHTMQGGHGRSGIITRSVETLLSSAASISQKQFGFTLEFVEVYCDNCRDLLASTQGSKVVIQADKIKRTGTFKSTTVAFTTSDEFSRVLKDAIKRRATAATAMNRSSSRSHAILTINVFERRQTKEDKNALSYALGKIQLVDLAGSERLDHGSNETQTEETKSINKSLSLLSRVITSLNSGSGVIPFRDSKLTWQLKDAFHGDSKLLVICNIAPGRKFLSGTRSTIEFATQAKSIKATKNQVAEKEAQERAEKRRNQDAVFNIAVEAEVARRMAQIESERLRSSNLASAPSTQVSLSLDQDPPDRSHASSAQQAIPPSIAKEAQTPVVSENNQRRGDPEAKASTRVTTEEGEKERYRRQLNRGLEKKLNKYKAEDPRVDRGKYARACIIAGKMALDERNDLEYAVMLFEKAIGLYPENERLLEETLVLKKRLRAERKEKTDPGNPPNTKSAVLLSTRKGNTSSSTSKKVGPKSESTSKDENIKKRGRKGKDRAALAAAIAAFGESEKEDSGSEDEVEKSLGLIDDEDLSDGEGSNKKKSRRKGKTKLESTKRRRKKRKSVDDAEYEPEEVNQGNERPTKRGRRLKV